MLDPNNSCSHLAPALRAGSQKIMVALVRCTNCLDPSIAAFSVRQPQRRLQDQKEKQSPDQGMEACHLDRSRGPRSPTHFRTRALQRGKKHTHTVAPSLKSSLHCNLLESQADPHIQPPLTNTSDLSKPTRNNTNHQAAQSGFGFEGRGWQSLIQICEQSISRTLGWQCVALLSTVPATCVH